MKRYILYLVRRRLGLKRRERFVFANQKAEGIYFFSGVGLIKETIKYNRPHLEKSGVSLNFLLSKECKIIKL